MNKEQDLNIGFEAIKGMSIKEVLELENQYTDEEKEEKEENHL